MARTPRIDRMEAVLHQRLGHVRCAIESVYHRHNVSAVLRTADSLGLHHVHLVEGTFRPVRGTARGAERWLELEHHESAAQAMDALHAAGCQVWVADLDPDGVAPENIPLDRPICLWFGAELTGISPEARARADGVLTIPMRGFAQSLNVSVAAAMALRAVSERARRELGAQALLDAAERDRTWERWMGREASRGRAIDALAHVEPMVEDPAP